MLSLGCQVVVVLPGALYDFLGSFSFILKVLGFHLF